MTLEIKSEVIIPAVGKLTHEHRQEFSDDSNVFGLISDYHKYMEYIFPGCKYKAVNVRRVLK